MTHHRPVGATRAIGAAVIVACAAMAWPAVHAQDRVQTEMSAQRVSERMRALQAEAAQLVSQSRTLLTGIRALTIQRDIEREKAQDAEAALVETQALIDQGGLRYAELEQVRAAQGRDLSVRLTDIYKRGRGRHVRLLFDAAGVREFARAMRTVTALAAIDARRVQEHQQTLNDIRQQQATLEERAQQLRTLQAEAERARAAARVAIATREEVITRIDEQRDLTADLIGQLDLAYQTLQKHAAELGAGRGGEPVSVPMAPFRGALEWPSAGRLMRGFGPAGPGATGGGIEISAPSGTAVVAVHPGTVGSVGPVPGLGILVVVDHGDRYASVYGHLSSASVQAGQRVAAGSEVGRAGTTPTGAAALYFEIRVDGRSVDPVQWLKPR